ncbi:HPP family protein [Streptomyces sp. NPDC088745]|uniref:HPP family protein n=1 Tax=Streptomyces sp. NPDC088745 TaxID=3365884 RepID=UPI0037F9A8D6
MSGAESLRAGGAGRVPGARLRDALGALTTGAVALGLVLVLAVAQSAAGLHVFAIPFVATAAVLALAPGAPLARPRAILVAYPVAAATALAVTAVAGPSPYTAAVAVAVSVALMAWAGAPHVPAVPAAAAIGLQDPGLGYVLDPLVPGVLLVLGAALAAGRVLPRYAYGWR